MDDEEVLAAILVAASALLLILAVITLCIIVSRSGRNKQKSPEIPMSTIRHHSTNVAFENDQDHKAKEETAIDAHKADWPTNYTKYAVSRSYAYPKKGEASHQSNPSSTNTSSTHQHKTFSEEVFSNANTKSHTTGGNHTKQSTGSNTATNHINGHDGVWKYRSGSTTESTDHQSLDRHSTTSTASHSRDYSHLPEQKPSYYSTFKTHKLYVSPAGQQQSKQTTSQQEKINSTHQREKLNHNAASSSDNVKIFKFNIT